MPDSLLMQARAGDRQAFATLVRAHQGSVFSIGLRMLNRRDAAEDLAQDVFLQLYRKLDTIESLRAPGILAAASGGESRHRLAAARAVQRARSRSTKTSTWSRRKRTTIP